MLAKRATLLLFLAIVAIYFLGLGHLPLIGPDEPRYTEVAREMFLRHDLVTPTLGGHLWFEKPALLYWMMIGSFKLFGVTEWSARLPGALCGLLTIAAVFVVGRRVERDDKGFQGYAFWSVLAAATMIGLVGFSRAASFDIVLTMTTAWTLAFYFLYDLADGRTEEGNSRQRFLIGFYAFIGLSLLAKGLVGIVIPAGVLGLYHLFQRRLPARKTLISVVWGLPLVMIVAAIWYAPVISRHGWLFIDQFFIQHHFARYVSNKYHHAQPIYYYLIIVPLLVLPWTIFLFDGLLQCKSWWRSETTAPDRLDEPLNRLMVFCFAWLLFPLIFFSFSGSKLPGYVLPLLPAAAFLAGRQLWRVGADSKRWPLRMTAALFLLFAMGALVYAWRTANFSHTAALMLAAPLAVAGCAAFFFARKQAVSVLLLTAGTVFVLIVAMFRVAPAFAERDSSSGLLQLADARGYSQTMIYGMQRSDRTPEFYAAGRVSYGADGEPIMYDGPDQLISESRKRGEVVLAFVPLQDVSQLTGMATAETEVIGNNGRYAIVAVRAR